MSCCVSNYLASHLHSQRLSQYTFDGPYTFNDNERKHNINTINIKCERIMFRDLTFTSIHSIYNLFEAIKITDGLMNVIFENCVWNVQVQIPSIVCYAIQFIRCKFNSKHIESIQQFAEFGSNSASSPICRYMSFRYCEGIWRSEHCERPTFNRLPSLQAICFDRSNAIDMINITGIANDCPKLGNIVISNCVMYRHKCEQYNQVVTNCSSFDKFTISNTRVFDSPLHDENIVRNATICYNE